MTRQEITALVEVTVETDDPVQVTEAEIGPTGRVIEEEITTEGERTIKRSVYSGEAYSVTVIDVTDVQMSGAESR